jgi:hypothetical protein
MLRRMFAFTFILSLLVGFREQEAQAAHPRVVPFQAMFDVLEAQPVQPVLEALYKAKVSGSFVFPGFCDWSGCTYRIPEFPRFREPTRPEGTTVQILREILADDPSMQVTQEKDGTIRMNETGVPTDLLNVKIGHILFESYGQRVYTANGALRVILETPEVLAFMKAHDIRGPYGPFDDCSGHVEVIPGNLFGAWPPESPHVSGSLDSVTLSEALDYVLKTFPGIWIYETCPQRGKKNRVVYFRFLAVHKVGSEGYVSAD